MLAVFLLWGGRVTEIIHLKDLTPDSANARRHTPRNVGLIMAGSTKRSPIFDIVPKTETSWTMNSLMDE